MVQSFATGLVHCRLSQRRLSSSSECTVPLRISLLCAQGKMMGRLKSGHVCSGDLVRLDHPDIGLLLLVERSRNRRTYPIAIKNLQSCFAVSRLRDPRIGKLGCITMSRGTLAGSLLLLCLSLIASVYGGRYSEGVLNLPGPPLGENFEGALTPSLLTREPARSIDAMFHVPIVDARSRSKPHTLLREATRVHVALSVSCDGPQASICKSCRRCVGAPHRWIGRLG